jgi:hypothetical protein
MLCERANNKVLTLKYLCLITSPKIKGRKINPLYQSLPIRRAERDNMSEYQKHLATICDHLEIDFDMDLIIERWGKCIISENVTLRSRILRMQGKSKGHLDILKPRQNHLSLERH